MVENVSANELRHRKREDAFVALLVFDHLAFIPFHQTSYFVGFHEQDLRLKVDA
jgi:hypothetical protein